MKLEEKLRINIRTRGYSRKTETAYIGWYKKFVRFHGLKHPGEMGADEIQRFLNHLTIRGHVSPSTHRQALCAIVFLYKHVLGRDPGEFKDLAKPARKRSMPVVLSQDEAGALLSGMSGQYYLMAAIMYGSGLRLNECMSLRVKDLDFNRNAIIVRDGKGGKDRVVPMPKAIKETLRAHLVAVRKTHMEDLMNGHGSVELPNALHKKLPGASREWIWQYIWPAAGLSRSPKTGMWGRWHIFDTTIQRAVKAATKRAGIQKRVGCHTLRHSFATHLVENGTDIRTVQELMGHKHITTTQIYVHVVQAGRGVTSPLDNLLSAGLSGREEKQKTARKKYNVISNDSKPGSNLPNAV